RSRARPITASGAGVTVFSAEKPSGSTPSSTEPASAVSRRSASACICGSSGMGRNLPTAGAAPALHPLDDRLAPLLEVSEREPLDVGGDAEPGLHGVDVDRDLRGVDADLAQDALSVRLREVRVDVDDLLEEIEIGRQRRRRAV